VLLLSYTVAGIWHSQTLFEEMGWEYPQTWDEMLEFGDMVLETTDMYPWTYQGKYPGYMVWGVLMPLVYKNGGIEAIIAMDNLEEGAFSSDAVKTSLEQLQELYTRGQIMPGTEGLTHTESQAEWLQNKAVFIPSGTWLENEMRDLTPEDFDMVIKPVPGTEESNYASVLAWSGENFIVPTNGENPEGGMEYLRALMSKENAKWFAQNVGAIMPVAGGTEGVELSPAVVSAVAAAEASGEDTFNYMWGGGVKWYFDLDTEAADRTGDLLTGRISPDEWMEAMEAMAAQTREDPDIIKYTRE
jgi:N-acetylglucosamine transport system substrate-binding protein